MRTSRPVRPCRVVWGDEKLPHGYAKSVRYALRSLNEELAPDLPTQRLTADLKRIRQLLHRYALFFENFFNAHTYNYKQLLFTAQR